MIVQLIVVCLPFSKNLFSLSPTEVSGCFQRKCPIMVQLLKSESDGDMKSENDCYLMYNYLIFNLQDTVISFHFQGQGFQCLIHCPSPGARVTWHRTYSRAQ